jgi:N6-adenosine-specific RNA methylase IME4
MSESVSLLIYETARTALAEAVRVDEVKNIRTDALKMKAYAKIARDKHLQADAAEIVLRAERRLGVLIISAKETGQLGIGRRSNLDRAAPPVDEPEDEIENGSSAEPFTRTTLAEAGIDKKLSMKAQAWAKLGDPDFEAKLQEVRNKIESTGATIVNPAKDLSTAGKKARREQRESELGAKQRALPDRQYGVILADPEWKFETYSANGLDRSADNHYPTSTLEAIKARDVASIAAKDAVLFLWATAPMLPQALEVMAAWGFAYKSQVIWRKAETVAIADALKGIQSAAKLILGTGYWFRNGHELLLVGTRGDLPAPAMGDQWASVLDASPLRHSEKPALFHQLVEAYFPSLPKIELNARAARDGWDTWGNEAPQESMAARMDVPGSLPVIETRPVPSENGGGYTDNGAAKALTASSEVPWATAGTQAPPIDIIQTAGQTVDQGEGVGFASRFLAELQESPVSGDTAEASTRAAPSVVAIVPETANETAGGVPVAAAPVKAEQLGETEATRGANPGTSSGSSDVTGGESAAANSDAADLVSVAGDGEGGAALPVSEQNAIILEAQAATPPWPLALVMEKTGLTRDQVKKRRQALGVASRDNQKAAVIEANKRRAGK